MQKEILRYFRLLHDTLLKKFDKKIIDYGKWSSYCHILINLLSNSSYMNSLVKEIKEIQTLIKTDIKT